MIWLVAVLKWHGGMGWMKGKYLALKFEPVLSVCFEHIQFT